MDKLLFLVPLSLAAMFLLLSLALIDMGVQDQGIAERVDGQWDIVAHGWANVPAQWPLLFGFSLSVLPAGIVIGWCVHQYNQPRQLHRLQAQQQQARQEAADWDKQRQQYQTTIDSLNARLRALADVSGREKALTQTEARLAEEKTALEQAKTALDGEKTKTQRYWQGWAENRVKTAELAAAEAQRQREDAEQRRHNAAATAERLRRKFQRHAAKAVTS